MDEDVASDVRRREELRLIELFLRIVDPGKRQSILKRAEQLADEAASEVAELAFASSDPSLVEARPEPSPGSK
jgi:alpha-galactosidase/6-phospho-beta-glucosidase family protein